MDGQALPFAARPPKRKAGCDEAGEWTAANGAAGPTAHTGPPAGHGCEGNGHYNHDWSTPYPNKRKKARKKARHDGRFEDQHGAPPGNGGHSAPRQKPSVPPDHVSGHGSSCCHRERRTRAASLVKSMAASIAGPRASTPPAPPLISPPPPAASMGGVEDLGLARLDAFKLNALIGKAERARELLDLHQQHYLGFDQVHLSTC